MRGEAQGTSYSVRPGVAISVVPDCGAFIVSERGQWMTTSPLLQAVCSSLGRYVDADALAARLSPNFGAADVYFALEQLRRAGIVTDDPPEASTGAAEAWRFWSNPVAGLRVAASGGTLGAAEVLVGALTARGIALSSAARGAPDGSLTLIVSEDPLGLATAEIEAASAGDAWIPVKLTGERCWFGPRLGKDGSCWACFAARLAGNRPVESYLAARSGRPFGWGPGPSGAVGERGRAAASALAEVVAERRSVTRIVECVDREGRTRLHDVPPRANCPVCGDPTASPEPEPPALDARGPLRRDDGGYRRDPPELTSARLAPFQSDLTGLIAAEYEMPAGPSRHVHAAAFRTVPRDTRPDADAFSAVALGKGRTVAQARTSALCEAVERLSSRWREGMSSRHATLAELGADAISPDRLWLFSDAQYADRERINAATADPRRHVPPRLRPDEAIAWTRSWSLTRAAWCWVPREHDWANGPEPRHGRFNPNGCAAGGCLEEAVVQGFLELVERDAVAIWWYNRLSRPTLPGGVPDDPALRDLVAGIEAQGWRIWLLDLTTDLGIATAAAVARAEDDGRWCIGFGCHFEVAIAGERALTELAQLFRRDGRDGPPPWAAHPDMGDAHLRPHLGAKAAPAAPPDAADFGELVAWCAHLVEAWGMEMLVTVQTHPDIGLPAAKVSVPGLRHFWPRFARGRLYEVPVRLGWRTALCREEALNPVGLFV